MKAILIFICSILFHTLSFAQSPDPSVLASAGGVNTNSRLSLEWTLGETSIGTLSSSNNLYTEGFHQPVIIVAKSKKPEIVKTRIRDIHITIAPNPVLSALSVKFSGKIESRISLSLVSASGKIILQSQHLAKSNTSTIAMSHLPGGVYFLRVTDANGLIKSFEIIKL